MSYVDILKLQAGGIMFNKSFQGLNVAELLVRCLESQGSRVFGIPGAKIDPVFEALAMRARAGGLSP